MSRIAEKVKEEFLKIIPPTIFFFITLSLVALIRALMLKGTGLPVSSPLQIAVGALILGKAVLIADLLPFINRFPDKPLIYNVAWKSAIYLVIAMLLHYLERLFDFWKEAGGFVAGNQKMLSEMVWPQFWAIQILLVVLIVNYCALHELVRLVGAAKMRDMFFGTPPGVKA